MAFGDAADQALGGTFHQILRSNASERCLFSVALTDGPTPDVLEVLDLGVEYGYFHGSTIGNKEGTDARDSMCSPSTRDIFHTRPNQLCRYKFVNNEALRVTRKPRAFLGKIRRHGVDSVLETGQLALFEDDRVCKKGLRSC